MNEQCEKCGHVNEKSEVNIKHEVKFKESNFPVIQFWIIGMGIMFLLYSYTSILTEKHNEK